MSRTKFFVSALLVGLTLCTGCIKFGDQFLPKTRLGETSVVGIANGMKVSTEVIGIAPDQTFIGAGHIIGREADLTVSGNVLIKETSEAPQIGSRIETEFTGLFPDTKFYVRAFLRQSSDSSLIYGTVQEFTTAAGTESSFIVSGIQEISRTSVRALASLKTDPASDNYGFVYSTTPTPVLNASGANQTIVSGDLGSNFNILIPNLSAGTTYYVRAFYQVGTGTPVYSDNEIKFRTID